MIPNGTPQNRSGEGSASPGGPPLTPELASSPRPQPGPSPGPRRNTPPHRRPSATGPSHGGLAPRGPAGRKNHPGRSQLREKGRALGSVRGDHRRQRLPDFQGHPREDGGWRRAFLSGVHSVAGGPGHPAPARPVPAPPGQKPSQAGRRQYRASTSGRAFLETTPTILQTPCSSGPPRFSKRHAARCFRAGAGAPRKRSEGPARACGMPARPPLPQPHLLSKLRPKPAGPGAPPRAPHLCPPPSLAPAPPIAGRHLAGLRLGKPPSRRTHGSRQKGVCVFVFY